MTKAISAQNAQVASGGIGARAEPESASRSPPLVLVKGQLTSPEEFGAIVLRANPDGSTVRLRDVARIEIGGLSYQFTTRLNGKPTAGLSVLLAPTGNALATATAVKAKMEELSQFFPANIKYDIPYNITPVVEASIEKVLMTLVEAVVLVFLVMFLFLQNIRYTLIPTIVVPVALLGTCACCWLLGFSINMLTMFAMVLAIGILVDDAIVVVENVERIMSEEGLPPQAKRPARRWAQITGAIIGITLVLVAVFIPMAFFPGSVGIIYQQFSRDDGGGDRLLGADGAVADAGAVRDLAEAGRSRPSPRQARPVRLVQPPHGTATRRLSRSRRAGRSRGPAASC